MNKNTKYWCAFSKLTKTASAFVNKLYNYFGRIDFAWNADISDLKQIEGVQYKSIESFIDERKKINPEECLEYILNKKIKYISLEDSEYPYLLKQTDNPPIGLFVAGSMEECNFERTLAVVGSRKASESSKKVLNKLISDFRGTDICIVSGMAEGIDTAAHKSALENNLKTIAVLGGGLDKIYPKSNKKLFEEIKNGGGAVITEYWPDTDAISWHFPARNRIISGLSKGVLVAEAAIKSGAMITANLALEQNRELMCIPGLISNPNTEGIYKLIKSGAGIVTNYQDILDEMNWRIIPQSTAIEDKKSSNNVQYTDNEALVIECVKKDLLTVDEIIMKTNLNINDLMVILTKLEIEGVLNRINGDKYIAQ